MPVKKNIQQDYQFDFLSSINYFGFKLMKDGRTIPPEAVSTTNIPKVIERAHEYGCAVYLSIYNNSPQEIAAFLESSKAHETTFCRPGTFAE